MGGHRRAALRFDRLDPRAEAVADTVDGPVRAPFLLPAEIAEGEVVGGRMQAPRILEPAPERVAAPCRHFRRCGGCVLQHAADPFIAEWKTARLRRALAQRGLETVIRPIRTVAPGARRRVGLAGRRLKSGGVVGFHGARDAALIPISHCPVADPAIEAALPGLTRAAELICSRKGEGRLVVTASEAGLDVSLSGARALEAELRAALAALAAEMDWARLSYGGEVVAQRRPPFHSVGAARVVPPPGGFLQAAAGAEADLAMAAAEAVGEAGRIADLFSGCGAFALRLAARAEVHAVEGEAAALAALDAAWRAAPGLRRVTTARRDLFRNPLRAAELEGYEAVTLDPPRQGAEAQARELAQSGVGRIALISCDPVSFARDAAVLVEGGYRLLWTQPIDQFRWSPHLEVAAALAR